MPTTQKCLAAITKEFADGVIGAVHVLLSLFRTYADPRAIEALRGLDLKGSKLWVVYKDVCCQDETELMMFIHAFADGVFTKEESDKYTNVLMGHRDREVASEMREKLVKPAVQKAVKTVLANWKDEEKPNAQTTPNGD